MNVNPPLHHKPPSRNGSDVNIPYTCALCMKDLESNLNVMTISQFVQPQQHYRQREQMPKGQSSNRNLLCLFE